MYQSLQLPRVQAILLTFSQMVLAPSIGAGFVHDALRRLPDTRMTGSLASLQATPPVDAVGERRQEARIDPVKISSM